MAERCCDLHNSHCEPPSELCCEKCTEAHHGWHRCLVTTRLEINRKVTAASGYTDAPSHHDGSACVLKELTA